jgi:hypothetical protein
VQEQGTMLAEHMARNAGSAHLAMGAASALDALSTIGRRQANPDTPAWDRAVSEREPLEDAFASRHVHQGRACEDIALRTTLLRACMRELAPAG